MKLTDEPGKTPPTAFPRAPPRKSGTERPHPATHPSEAGKSAFRALSRCLSCAENVHGEGEKNHANSKERIDHR